jgi:hypothetical protein
LKAKLNVYTDPAISEPPPLPSGTSSPATLASTGGSKTAESGNAATQETNAGQKESAAAALRGQAHAVPDEFSLGANYPNPFRTSTEIRFGLPQAAEVSLEVYDLLGRRVAVLASERMQAGTACISTARSSPAASTSTASSRIRGDSPTPGAWCW